MPESHPTSPSHEEMMLRMDEAAEAASAVDKYHGRPQAGGRSELMVGGSSHPDSIVAGITRDTAEGFRTKVTAGLERPIEKGGSARYVAKLQGRLDADTTIVRTDAQGNEIYKFKSKRPELARQVGIVAAGAVERSAEEKAA